MGKCLAKVLYGYYRKRGVSGLSQFEVLYERYPRMLKKDFVTNNIDEESREVEIMAEES